MKIEENVKDTNIDISKEDQDFILGIVSSYINSADTLENADTIKRILTATGKKIKKNDRKIRRLLNAVDYFDTKNGNGDRYFVEVGLSCLVADQVIMMDGMSVEDKALGCVAALIFMGFGFYEFKKLTNEKILSSIYKKLDDVAKKNGKLKGIYKDLDATNAYYDDMSEKRYVVIK